MLGKIKLKGGDEAELDDQGVWHCPSDEITEDVLNRNYSSKQDSGPYLMLPFGVGMITRAAKELGAKIVECPEVPKAKPGELY